MSLNLLDQNLSSSGSHYRVVTALDQEILCAANPGSFVEVEREVNLASFAESLDVPVVLATYYTKRGVRTYATHGLGSVNNVALLAAACNELCAEQAVAIANAKTHKLLGGLMEQWPEDDICFLVGIPLRNALGQLVGSLAVMNSQKIVARIGVSIRTLNAFGKALAQDSKLPEVAAR